MTNTRKLIRALRSLTIGAALFAAASGPATGFILNPGESVNYNFDFSSAGPPFSEYTYNFFNSASENEEVLLTVFDGLNATGATLLVNTIVCVVPTCSGVPQVPVGPFSEVDDDGLFSIRFEGLVGSFEVVPPIVAVAYDATGNVAAQVTGVSASVPEPGALALLGLGLAGLAALRKRKPA